MANNHRADLDQLKLVSDWSLIGSGAASVPRKLRRLWANTCALLLTELVEHEQQVKAGAFVMTVPNSARAGRFLSAANGPSCIAQRFNDFDCLYLIGQHILNPMPDLLEELTSRERFTLCQIRKNLTIFLISIVANLILWRSLGILRNIVLLY